MDRIQKAPVVILSSISVVGVLGIPLGDPKFILQALVLEGCFIALTILAVKNYKRIYIPNFIISVAVIVGNSAFHKHIEIMTTFHPLYNALVLIIGGYVLQVLLITTTYLSYRQHKNQTMIGKN
ncbi:MAG: hypothetical protein KGH89_06045 [Thaumarchaeota archaeon]|nr:hypothetical protein [Nitrososphaerota archaeon]